jgi:hypothetical protein
MSHLPWEFTSAFIIVIGSSVSSSAKPTILKISSGGTFSSYPAVIPTFSLIISIGSDSLF